MCDRAYPKKLAFQYLEDLKNEFERVNGAQIETAARPYAFIKFGMNYLALYTFFICILNLIIFFYSPIAIFECFFPTSPPMFNRYIHTEDEEIVPGYTYST